MSSQDTASGGYVGATSSAHGEITDAMLDALRGTKGWVRLLGILAFIAAAFTVVAAIVMTVGTGLMGSRRGVPPAGVMALIGVIYLLGGVIYAFLGLYLVKYSGAIGRLLRDGKAEAMEAALQYQRKFWRLAGIMSLVMLALVVLGIVAAISIPLFFSR